MLYTYPQQDGKYRLKNTLSLSGMKVHLFTSLTVFAYLQHKLYARTSIGQFVDWTVVFLPSLTQVSKPVLDNVLNCLRIEVSDITITLSARWASDSKNPFKRTVFVKSQAFEKRQEWLFFYLCLQFCWREGGLVPHTKSSHSGPCCRTLYIWWTLQWGMKKNLMLQPMTTAMGLCWRINVISDLIWFVNQLKEEHALYFFV